VTFPTEESELAATESFLLRAEQSVTTQRELIASMERINFPTESAQRVLLGFETMVVDARRRRDAAAARTVAIAAAGLLPAK